MGSISLYGAMGAALKTVDTLTNNKDGVVEIGGMLRDARQAFSLSLKDVATQIMVSEVHLRALEEGNWAALPAEVYARGYLRKYADFLGFEQEKIIAKLHPATASLELVKTPFIPKSSVRLGFHPVFILCLLVAVAIGIALFYQPTRGQMPHATIKSVPKSLQRYAEGHSLQAVRMIPSCLQQREQGEALWSCYFSLRLQDVPASHAYMQPFIIMP